jgi:hypothetical protein
LAYKAFAPTALVVRPDRDLAQRFNLVRTSASEEERTFISSLRLGTYAADRPKMPPNTNPFIARTYSFYKKRWIPFR